jgi:ketosteroid isomerase-like protein
MRLLLADAIIGHLAGETRSFQPRARDDRRAPRTARFLAAHPDVDDVAPRRQETRYALAMADTPLQIARALHRALEAGKSGSELRSLFTDDAKTIEHPNLIKPAGAVTTLERMLVASEAGAQLLAQQVYDVHHEQESGNLAICRLTWTGVIRRDVGPFREGQVLKAHIAQFIETREGRIASIETFDCYEPFA